MKIEIKNLKMPSWNTFYAGKHWSVRSRMAKEIHELVMVCAPRGKKFKKCKILFEVFYKGKRRHDPDNVAVKFLTDGLVLAGILEDDNSEIVKEIAVRVFTGMSDKVVITLSQI